MGVEPRETVRETGTMAARLPSSPETAVLPSRLMAPIHSRGEDSVNDVLVLGTSAITSEIAKGMEVTPRSRKRWPKSEEHTSELQSLRHLVCRLLLEKK